MSLPSFSAHYGPQSGWAQRDSEWQTFNLKMTQGGIKGTSDATYKHQSWTIVVLNTHTQAHTSTYLHVDAGYTYCNAKDPLCLRTDLTRRRWWKRPLWKSLWQWWTRRRTFGQDRLWGKGGRGSYCTWIILLRVIYTALKLKRPWSITVMNFWLLRKTQPLQMVFSQWRPRMIY